MLRYLLVIFCLFPSAVFAADFRFGLSADLGLVTVDDPDGDTKAGTYLGAAITGNYPLKWRGTSLVSGLGYIQGSSDASDKEIGQDFNGYYVFSRFQKRLAFSRSMQNLQAYGGLKFLSTKHTERHTVYQGYLLNKYKDREVNNINLNAGLGYQLSHQNGSQSTPSVYFDAPLSGDIFLIGFQYQYEF